MPSLARGFSDLVSALFAVVVHDRLQADPIPMVDLGVWMSLFKSWPLASPTHQLVSAHHDDKW